MVIRYVAYTWQGQKVEGLLDVATEEDARQLLHDDQLIPYRLITVRPRRTLVQIVPSLFQPKAKEIIEFSRGLASLLRSGIPMRETIWVRRQQSSAPGAAPYLRVQP